jgi:hypothetical protein
MSRSLPNTADEIKTEFADRYNYFTLMRMVSQSRGSSDQRGWCSYARRVMLTLGYPSETAEWGDIQMCNYADNIVMMG